jgi:hypothetical protein
MCLVSISPHHPHPTTLTDYPSAACEQGGRQKIGYSDLSSKNWQPSEFHQLYTRPP